MINCFILDSLLKNILLIILLLFLPLELFASDNRITDFAYSSKWVRSLHYKTSFSKLKLGTSIPGFYLSTTADPYQELLKNLEEANNNISYQCLFPYRAKLLSRAGLWKLREINCTTHSDWRSVFSTEKLSLAFASQYLSNPASVFGHTFLVLSPDRKEKNPHPRFLDVTISYAAQMPPNVGAFDYAIKGIGGGFKGRFFDEPFYQRIYEYTRMEMRDIWVYPIKISSAQIDDFLDHVFELTVRDYFPYYFADENCSYMLLRMLEVIFDEKQMSETFHSYVLPIETIKILNQENLLEKGEIIPSMRSKFLAELDLLTGYEKHEVMAAIRGDMQRLTTKDSIDTMITYMDKTKIENKGVSSLKEQQDFQSLLLKRSKLGPKIEKKIDYPTLDPAQSHDPYAVSVKAGQISGKGFQELEFRPAFHEIIDQGHGYIKHSQIKLLSPTARLDDRGGLKLQQFQFFNIGNLVSFRMVDPIFSWKVLLERTTLQDKLCFDCKVTRGSLGFGFNLSLGSMFDYYILPGYKFEWGSDLEKNFRNGPGIFSGFIFDFKEKIKANISLDYFYADRWGKFKDSILSPAIEGSYHFSNRFSIRSTYREWRTFPVSIPTRETSASIVHFF